MTNTSSSSVAKRNRLLVFKQVPSGIAIGAGVCLVMGVLWSLIIQPLQQTLEQRLQRYPSQLMSIQELNRTLLAYKDKNVKISPAYALLLTMFNYASARNSRTYLAD